MARRPGIFPTFFLSGFECSTFLWKDQGRRDLAVETQHRERLDEDYGILRHLGIAVVREGVPWPMVDRGGAFDFTAVDPMIEALRRANLLPIWDMCHYGYPDDLDPFDEGFDRRYAAYCDAFVRHVSDRLDCPTFFTPINEITFFAFCGGNWGWVAPFLQGEENRHRLRLALCRAAIAGIDAIRAVDPAARFVNVDPLVLVVAPEDRPDLADEAREETYDDTFLAWDVLAGRRHPGFGGSPEHLDIVGVNCYSFGQMEFGGQDGPHTALGPHDDRIVPLCSLLEHAWQRYGRPMIIAETSGLGDGRPAWLDDVMQESLAAVDRGVDLHGVCLFPAVDMPDWHTGEWLHNGICDLEDEGGRLRRVPYGPYVESLRRWQRELNRTTALDDDPFSDPVELQDVIDAAHRLQLQPDQNWS